MMSLRIFTIATCVCVVAFTGDAQAQICRGNAFPEGSMLAVATGAAQLPGATVPTLGIELASATEFLSLFPISNTFVGEIYKGGYSTFGASLGYAFGVPAPRIGPGALGICATPFFGFGSFDTSEQLEGFDQSYLGGGVALNVGLAIDRGPNTVVPFASLGYVEYGVSGDFDAGRSKLYVEGGTAFLLRDRFQLTGKVRLGDPQFNDKLRLSLTAGIGL